MGRPGWSALGVWLAMMAGSAVAQAKDLLANPHLQGWKAILADRPPGEDPKGVFRRVTVDGAAALRVSGEEWGGLITDRAFENYHLSVQFKWGVARHGPRAHEPRDSGILYHGSGPPVAKTGWVESVEFGILEGGETGDFWAVPAAEGKRIVVDVEGDPIPRPQRHYPDQPIRFRAGGTLYPGNALAVLSPRDWEKPRGEWNQLDLYCMGNTAIHVVNGQVAMVLTNMRKKENGRSEPLQRGAIQIQSEGAETYFRRMRIVPLPALPPAYRQVLPRKDAAAASLNQLSPEEQQAGWRLLFDGHSLAGFRSVGSSLPPSGWQVEDGTITLTKASGDLMTQDQWGDFELQVDWKISPGGNSGIFYRLDPHQQPVYRFAPEYELRDNSFWTDDPYISGAHYGMQAPSANTARPVGQWNSSRIVVRGSHTEHWLNGVQVVEYETNSPDWIREKVASKFAASGAYGAASRGHIAFQDHGAPVWFRNVKVKALAPGWIGEAPEAVNLPVPRPGWKMQLVATHPTIKHPTSIEVAPDGRVFVAEDPMDISAPRADMKLGRIVCLHPDGRITVFAEGLHAVFGLLYLDGKLIVLHNPNLSVFDDHEGVGANRRELISQTNPNPWEGEWNDHVPANLRLGMDGYLYMAVGDKGIFEAHGPDGRRINMRGGGVLRLRPDGTGMEVFATGVRNIMDVQIDDEDEIFTYDNTDEQQWMSRLTHMVDGGFYGYPFHFLPQRPYTLWMMADYGGGAATGGLSYGEDALPTEFRNNLFLADFGKRQILRVPTTRTGGTFRPLFREDLIPVPPHDFRPVGLAVAADGMGFYVGDWNHTDNKDQVEVGRLYKLSWTGTSLARPKPPWFVAAASGKPFTATLPELLAGLAHPSRRVRMVAQRRLIDRKATAALMGVLGNAAASDNTRALALWALDQIDEGRQARRPILALATVGTVALRRQALRQLGTRRVADGGPAMRLGLRATDASVRFHAATALGRLGQVGAIPELQQALKDRDLFARFAAFTALRRIGLAQPLSWPAIVKGLADPDERIREASAFALRDTYDESLGRALSALAQEGRTDAVAPVRAIALSLLADVALAYPPWKGEYLGTHPASSTAPPKTVPWAGTSLVIGALTGALGDASAEVRRAAIAGAGQSGARALAPALRSLAETEKDPQALAAILQALRTLGDRDVAPLVTRIIRDPAVAEPVLIQALAVAAALGGRNGDLDSALLARIKLPEPPAISARIIEALGAMKATEALDAIAPYRHSPDDRVRQAAFLATTHIAGKRAGSLFAPLLQDPSEPVRRDTVTALGSLRDHVWVPALLQAYQQPDLHDGALLALTHIPDVRALDAYLEGLAGRNAELRGAAGSALWAINREVLPRLEARVTTLSPALIAALQDVFDRSLQARKGPLFSAHAVRYEPADFVAYALKNSGDAAHGAKIFADPSGAACIRCHRVLGQGGEVGPDLSTIGAQSARQVLAESVVYPSKVVREGYQQTGIELQDGSLVTGIVRWETPDSIALRDASGVTHDIHKSDIKARQTSPASLMPEGLQGGMSPQDFADLLSYLGSLQTAPARP